MADKQDSAAFFKKEIKFPASFGDWTAYRPAGDRTKKIKALVYGFHRISLEELEETLKIHYMFAFAFARYLQEAIKASTEVLSISIEQLSYLDFLKRVQGEVIYNKLPIKDIGEVLFLIDAPLANTVINFSLGCQSVDTKTKEMTDLEESIIHSVFGNALKEYTSCWKNIFEMPKLEIISYPNIQRETHINLNEVITAISAVVSIANSASSTFTFVYQNTTLKKLNELLAKKTEKAPLNYSFLTDELLSSIEVPVVAEVGTTNIAAKDLPDIVNDDVIELDQKYNSPIKLIIGYASEVKAQPGIKENRLSARILGGGAKKIKFEPMVTLENVPAEAAKGETTAAKEEEDVELPLEVEEKEEYNEPVEGLFEEEHGKTDNENPQP